MVGANQSPQGEHSLLQLSGASRWYIGLAILSGLGLLGKSSLLAKFIHLPPWVVVAITALSLCMCLFWSFALRFRKILAPIFLASLLVIFLFVFPRVQGLHKQGRGSDQADCVIVAADRFVQHTWPYERSAMATKDPMSCGPGWVALQAPSIGLLGYRWNLVLCWVVSLAVIAFQLGWDETAGLVTLIGLSPGTWLTAANGCDFLTFGIVLLAFCVAIRSEEPKRSRLLWSITVLALGLIAQFRVVTLVIPGFFAKRLGRAAAIAAWAMGTAFQLGFLLWNPHSFVYDGPLHIAAKLMRTVIVSDRPVVAALEFCVASGIEFTVVLLFAAKTRSKQPLLLFLWLIFFLPACQDFILKYHRYGNVLRAFEFWEGGMWLEACVPLAAASLMAANLYAGLQQVAPQPVSSELPV